MINNSENFQQLVKDQQETIKTVTDTLSKATQRVSAEAVDYSKQSFKDLTAFGEKLRGVTSLDEAIKLQTEFAKSSYESLVTQSTKMIELFTSLGKEASQPIQANFAKATDLAKTQGNAIVEAATKVPFKAAARAD